MTHTTSFWRRMSGLLGRSANGNHGAGSVVEGDAPVTGTPGNRETRWRRSSTGLSLPRQRPEERVATLVDALTRHFERSDVRAEELTQAVHRMAAILEQMPDVQRSAGESMNSIAAHLETANRRAGELRETLAKVPLSIEAQAAALLGMTRRMEASAECDVRLAECLEKLRQSVDSSGNASAAQVEALRLIQTENSRQRDALSAMIRAQGRRFTLMLVVLTVMTLTMAAVALWIAGALSSAQLSP